MRPVIDPTSPLKKDPRGRAFDRLGAVSVILAALGARLFYLHQLRGTPLFNQLLLDPFYYVDWARRIAAGDWLSGNQAFEQSPLYAYILAATFRILGDGLLYPRLVQAFLGAGTCLLVFVIGRRVLGRTAGLAAGLLAALYAPGVFYDGMVMKTSWAVFLTAAMTAALVHSEGSRRTLLFAGGVFLGLASLVRGNLILLAPLLAGWLAVDGRVRAGMVAGWARESVARVGWLAAGAILMVAPVTARNIAVSGEWVLLTAGGGEVFYIGNNAAADGRYSPPFFVRANSGLEHEDFRAEAARRLGRPVSRREASNYWLSEGARWIFSDPAGYLSLQAKKLLIFLNAYELPDNQNFYHHRAFVPALRGLPTWALLLPLAAAGIILSLRGWRDLLPLYVIGAGYAGTVLLFFNFARFRMPLVPILIVFAGGALTEIPALMKPPLLRGRTVGAFLAAAGAVVVALLPLQTDALHRGQSDSQMADLLGRAGRWEDARQVSDTGIRLLESIHVDAGGLLNGDHGVPPPGGSGRAPLGDTYYAVLMEAYRTRSGIAHALEANDASLAWLERAAAAAPDSIIAQDTLTAFSEALISRGRVAEALDPILRARRVDPTAIRPALIHAQILHRSGRSREALRIVNTALDANPHPHRLDLADANYALGLIFRALGDPARVRFHFREALNNNPRHPRAEWIRRILAEADASEGLLTPPGD
jgi:4-amino-4-deoxy-L-arabinose transferase-like glycosyltransferase